MKIINRRAFHNFQIVERMEAGINLLGSEVKSVKAGRIKLDGSYVRIIGTEVYLVNSQIPIYPYARPEGYDSKRTRKLLLNKGEIISLKGKLGKNLTIVPLSCYTSRGLIKLEIALAKGKKRYIRREEKRKRDIDREVARELRGK